MRVAALLAALASAVVLTACEDKADAQAGVSWLQEYYKKNPPNKIWRFARAKAETPELISVDVVVPESDDVDFIRTQSSMKRLALARFACPRQPNTFGDVAGKTVRVQINLIGGGALLINSICPH